MQQIMNLIRWTTRSDEEFALTVIMFSVGRRATRLRCCGDCFNCPDIERDQLMRKLLRLFSLRCAAQLNRHLRGQTEDGGDVFSTSTLLLSASLECISRDFYPLCCEWENIKEDRPPEFPAFISSTRPLEGGPLARRQGNAQRKDLV